MSMQRHGDGHFWSSLFSVNTGEQKKEILQKIKNSSVKYSSSDLAFIMLRISNMSVLDYNLDDTCVEKACERVALDFLLSYSDIAEDLLGEEEYEKAKELYSRNQYNSKILTKLLCDFLLLLNRIDSHHKSTDLFTLLIDREYRKLKEEEFNRSFGTLKRRIEIVTSGIKISCYSKAEIQINYTRLDDSLNSLLIEKIKYDYNKMFTPSIFSNERSTLFGIDQYKVSNEILQTALLDDVDFWTDHKRFDVIAFLNAIREQNGIKHAQKVLYFLIDNLSKMPHMEIVFKHNFPLWVAEYEKLVEELEEQAFRFSFKRLASYCDLSKIKSTPLCYPMSKVDESFFEIGKKVWDRFISEYNYPNKHKEVVVYLEKEVKRFISGETHNNNDIAVILDAAPFRYQAENEDRQLFIAYHPDCFSYENIWKRVYLKAYAVTLLSDDDQTQFAYLQRLFVDLIKTIEKDLSISTAHQDDSSVRTEHYEKLKNKLETYGIETNDLHKSKYVISLLDRDTALIKEAEQFPVLEQAGDAIYGLAVAELLFFNPDNLFYPKDSYDPDGKNIAKRFEDFTRAEAQVFISKKQGFNELYLQIGLPAKYIEHDSLYFDYSTFEEEYAQYENKEKYLADSLEMIIGSVYYDKGIEVALGFAKRLLRETFPDHFSKEVHLRDRKKVDYEIDYEYWQRIHPAPYTDLSQAHQVLWGALNKVILVDSLGTENSDKRKYITLHQMLFSIRDVYGEDESIRGISWPLLNYLDHGLNYVLKEYRHTISKNYEASTSKKQ